MAAPRIVITGGRLIDPANGIDKDHTLYIARGRVAAVGTAPDGFHMDLSIHVPGHIVCPGFIDLCARVREPGQEHKATIASETAAAVRAGITMLCCPPDTIPVIDTPAVAELIKDRAERIGMARILPIGAVTRGLMGKELSEMRALKKAGCIAVSNASTPIENLLVLRRTMEYAASSGLLVIFRPEDPWLRNQGVAHEGAVATRLGLPAIPEAAETVAVAQVLALIEQTGVRVHFAQLSCARAVSLVANAQSEGLPVTSDVSAHQLHLSDQDLVNYDPLFHVIPPLRTEQDRDALRRGLANGVITAVCSDHQPHEEGAKLNAFSSTEPGMATLETLLPLVLRLVNAQQVDRFRVISSLTSGPANVLGLNSGQLGVGAIADICIFDPNAIWVPVPNKWASSGQNTPFFGQQMQGQVTHTLIAGRIVYERD